MNPLCCIAPISVEGDNNSPAVVKQRQLGVENSTKNVTFAPNPSFSTQASSLRTDADGLHQDTEDIVVEPRDSKVFCGNGDIAGVLYKWVNYGKGWKSRWFVLEDGVLSYYKIHGPDKILMSPEREKRMRVIGDDSLRYIRKTNSNHNGVGGSKQWKPFGEIHLKVYSCLYMFFLCGYFCIFSVCNCSL